jgi:NADH dehydrogenase
VKVLLTIFFFMWIRWSWPRFRYDQLMDLAWKAMIPLGVVNLFVSAVCQEFLAPGDMLTRCLLGWLAVAGVIIYMAMSARPPIGSQARWPGELGVGTDSKRIGPPGLSVSKP